MKNRAIVPLTQLGYRPPEAGRIRLGNQVPTASGKKRPDKLGTLRFTSADEQIINDVARLYGGTPRPWFEKAANPPNQHEVITTVTEVPVYLTRDGLSTQYEAWSGGGVQRRCDGVQCQTNVAVGEHGDYEQVMVDCICVAQNVRLCNPTTRLKVILPELAFRGVWRLESHGWNAALELPAMFDLIGALTEAGVMVRAMLGMQQRQEVKVGKTRQYVVPVITLLDTVEALQAGAGNALAIRSGVPSVERPALGAGTPVTVSSVSDDEPIEAELVDDELLALEAKIRVDGVQFGLDGERYLAAVRLGCKADRVRMEECVRLVRGELLEPLGFTAKGTVQWKDNRTSEVKT